ncbi:MAG: Pyruvate formate-lyase [Paenibacillaceae bacterium]|jgi:pyruvate-formate lyase|nr:Pyruvate formate-lyase [Paenibacillaceae bacterium]
MSLSDMTKQQDFGISPLVAQAVAFTNTYKKHQHDPAAIREAMCLKQQYPALMGEIRMGDWFAGRRPGERIVYAGSIWWAAFPGDTHKPLMEGKQGGYVFDFAAVHRSAGNPQERKLLEELTEFWSQEATILKTIRSWDDELAHELGQPGQIAGYSNGFSLALDLDRLVQKGLPGLKEDILSRKPAAEAADSESGFFTGLWIAVEVLEEVCRHYEAQARDLARKAVNPGERCRLEAIARSLAGIIDHPPESFREAVQLVWLYVLVSGGKHLEAWGLDVALGDLYAHDRDQGVITEEEGVGMLSSLWRLFHENGEAATCRIGIGGKGRRNEEQADRVALIAMEATKRHRQVTPQLMLRFHKGQNPLLLKTAYDTIHESCTYPLLYNDDAIIPGIARIFGVSGSTAERYHPLGCGEYMLAGLSPSMLDMNWNIPKALEAVLHDGLDADGNRIGPRTGSIGSLDTFDKLYQAFAKQIRFAADLSARAYQKIREVYPRECAFLYASLLTDDCLERGRSAFDGGMRYIGGCAMGHGFTNAADSLTAIRQLVYREQRITLAQLVSALDADFENQEPLRRLLLDAPKYGNNHPEADDMLAMLYKDINRAAQEAGLNVGLDFHTVSSVNPGGYGMGFGSGATADGRRKGQPYAIGNSPTSGFDRNGLTALLQSAAKVDPANGGAVTNFKLSREFFTGERAKLEALFSAFFAKGGLQANITVVNKQDLEAALERPDQYPHVLVRVGGWTARFIDLERSIQEDMIRRTLY